MLPIHSLATRPQCEPHTLSCFAEIGGSTGNRTPDLPWTVVGLATKRWNRKDAPPNEMLGNSPKEWKKR